VNYEVKV